MENAKIKASERLRYLIQLKNMTIQEFSEFVEVPKSTLEKYLNTDAPPKAALLSTLYAKMKVSAHWLLDGVEPMYLVDMGELEARGGIPIRYDNSGPSSATLQADQETMSAARFVQIPRYSVSASAGNSAAVVSGELEVSYYAFSEDWINRRGLDAKELQIVNVRGDSMEPTLYDGDLILLDRTQRHPADGQTFVVRLWDEHVVKHVQRVGEKTISLISANKVYPPREVELVAGNDTDFEIIGRVVASMHEW